MKLQRSLHFVMLGLVTAVSPAAAQICQWSGVGGGMNNDVRTLRSFDDGTGPALYGGGTFSMAGGGPARDIARWDGAQWIEIGGGVNGHVNALTVFDDGTGPALYAGGYFTTAGGLAAPYIARWSCQ